MGKLWTLMLAPILALAFIFVGVPNANAFGGEVLGCDWGSGWVSGNCGRDDGTLIFSAHNLSGSYSYNWTITSSQGYSLDHCGGGVIPCILSGCTATSSSCTVDAEVVKRDRIFTANLVLTQSGQSRTIQAQATVIGEPICNC